jgi:hypothetical protein
MFLFLLTRDLEVEFWGYGKFISFKETTKMAVPVYILTVMCEGSSFSHPYQSLLFLVFLIIVIPVGVKENLWVFSFWVGLGIEHRTSCLNHISTPFCFGYFGSWVL